MPNENEIRKEIVQMAKKVYDNRFVVARAGNISSKVDEKSFLISPHQSSLGFLTEDTLAKVDMAGNVLSGPKPSVELLMYLAIYKNTKANCVIHAHPPFTTAILSVTDDLDIITFETRFNLGKVPVIKQETPTVTDIESVLASLKKNNIIVLQNHGVVAIGPTLLDALFLIDELEEAAKMSVVSRLFKKEPSSAQAGKEAPAVSIKYKIFSKEQFDKIVELVNKDSEIQRLGKQTGLTTTMAIKLEPENISYNLHFKDGAVFEVTPDENAEFIISGTSQIWRAIFNGELDPFVATTQKKLNLKGDFGKISRWYAPCSRIFQVWKQVPIE